MVGSDWAAECRREGGERSRRIALRCAAEAKAETAKKSDAETHRKERINRDKGRIVR